MLTTISFITGSIPTQSSLRLRCLDFADEAIAYQHLLGICYWNRKTYGRCAHLQMQLHRPYKCVFFMIFVFVFCVQPMLRPYCACSPFVIVILCHSNAHGKEHLNEDIRFAIELRVRWDASHWSTYCLSKTAIVHSKHRSMDCRYETWMTIVSAVATQFESKAKMFGRRSKSIKKACQAINCMRRSNCSSFGEDLVVFPPPQALVKCPNFMSLAKILWRAKRNGVRE